MPHAKDSATTRHELRSTLGASTVATSLLASNIISLMAWFSNHASILWLITFPRTFRGEAGTPYIGILLFLSLPGCFSPVCYSFQSDRLAQPGNDARLETRGPFLPRGGELRRLAIS